MLEVIKYVNLSTHRLSRNNVVTLGHISGFVYLSGMIDLSLDLYSFVF